MEPTSQNDVHKPFEPESEPAVSEQSPRVDAVPEKVEHTFVPPTPVVDSSPLLSDTPRVNTPVKGGAYLPEYFVMLVLLYVIVSSVTSLIGTGIASLAPVAESSSSYGYSYDNSSFELAWSLSALLATLPLFSWLFVRTRKVESAAPAVKTHRWRKAFLGTFLVAQTLAVVWIIGTMLFKLISPLLGEGESGSIFDYFFATSGADTWWVTVTSSLIAAGIISFVVFMMSEDYRNVE